MNIKKIIIIVLTGIAILVTGILCKQQWFLMVPLFVSLFVMAFQSEANRLGVLIGAGNALLYTATYICMGVYVSAASAVLFSFPIQLMTFFRWKKNAYKNTVVFKKMSTKVRIICTAALLALWAVTAAVFYHLEYEYALFDSLLFLLIQCRHDKTPDFIYKIGKGNYQCTDESDLHVYQELSSYLDVH